MILLQRLRLLQRIRFLPKLDDLAMLSAYFLLQIAIVAFQGINPRSQLRLGFPEHYVSLPSIWQFLSIAACLAHRTLQYR
jgi:hypothetical protein